MTIADNRLYYECPDCGFSCWAYSEEALEKKSEHNCETQESEVV